MDSVRLKYVKLGYKYSVNNFLKLLVKILRMGRAEILAVLGSSSLHLDWTQILFFSLLAVIIFTVYLMWKPRPIYLVDYALYKPSPACRVSFSTFVEHSRLNLSDSPKSVEFQMRILERSGLGDETCLAPAIHYIPVEPTMEAAREEAEMAIFTTIDDLLSKTGVKPGDIDILIVNCSLFSPTPSLSAMVINKYKMRSCIKSFSLSGMGCSCSPISVHLAQDLLKVIYC